MQLYNVSSDVTSCRTTSTRRPLSYLLSRADGCFVLIILFWNRLLHNAANSAVIAQYIIGHGMWLSWQKTRAHGARVGGIIHHQHNGIHTLTGRRLSFRCTLKYDKIQNILILPEMTALCKITVIKSAFSRSKQQATTTNKKCCCCCYRPVEMMHAFGDIRRDVLTVGRATRWHFTVMPTPSWL